MSVLEIQALTKRYGRLVAVDDVTFSVEEGMIFGLLGQNGCGKTTTLSCALGLCRPSSGRASILGFPAGQIHRTAGRVGVVFDAPIPVKGLRVRGQMRYSMGLFGAKRAAWPRTVGAGTTPGGKQRRAAWRTAREALALVGLEKLQGRSVTKLSLGQQKRLAVATALAGAPEVLVLDEPLSGLDPLGARDLLNLFRTLAAEGMTLILSSHRLRDIEPVLSHAAVLLDGKIATQGSMEELLGNSDRYHVVVDQGVRARAALKTLAGINVSVSKASHAEMPGEAFTVDGSELDPIELSRVLVHAGVGLREIRPADRGLLGLFESLAGEPAEKPGGLR